MIVFFDGSSDSQNQPFFEQIKFFSPDLLNQLQSGYIPNADKPMLLGSFTQSPVEFGRPEQFLASIHAKLPQDFQLKYGTEPLKLS